MVGSSNVNRLVIPSPCSANYSAMQEVPEGKHCTICAMAVTDFTGWSKEEILVYLRARTNEKICGRFENRHLEKPGRKYNFKLALLTAFSLILFKAQSKAQQKPDAGMPDSVNVVSDSVVLVIRGELVDGHRLVHKGKIAALRANGDTISVAIGRYGRFELRVPVSHPQEAITIVATAPGFRTFRLTDYTSSGRNVLKSV
jgi:hypothetical protein